MVVPFKVSKPRPVASTKGTEKTPERMPMTPQEEEFDDYSLL